MLRPHGTCALVGLPPGDFATPILEVVLKRLTIRGSIVGTRMDLQESLDLAASGRVRSEIKRQSLGAINDVFDRMRRGAINGRVVLSIGD